MRFPFLCLFLGFALHGIGQIRVIVHRDTSIRGSISGRLFLYTSVDTVKGVPNDPDISSPQPMYRLDVKDWKEGATQVFDDRAKAYANPLSQLKPGVYALASIIDRHPEERGNGNNGNYYTPGKTLLRVDSSGRGDAHLYLRREIRREFRENDSLKAVRLRSTLLSTFHRKDVFIEAAVFLPPGYNAASPQTYPVVYIIPGWGGTHYDAMSSAPRKRYGIGQGLPKIYVLLNPETQTPHGLHAFVDSRVNGPWGQALVEELMPHIREKFHGSADPKLSFVMGQSSGGYPSLWLPLHYPKAFGGAWAVSPDPVDFSRFTGVDLYAKNANMYTDASGAERGFFRVDDNYLSTMRKAQSIEDFEDNGGQQRSFEAEFGKPGVDGRPKPLFDRRTGAVDPKVVVDWADYDLGRWIELNWSRVKGDLAGRLHVYAGSEDNFHLDQAVTVLADKAKKVGADIQAELIPGANHFTIWSPAFTARVQAELDALIAAASK